MGSSEKDNTREEVPYYVKDFGMKNEAWQEKSITDRLEKIKEAYTKTTRQRMQAKATPIREAVVVLDERHTMEDLHRLREALYERFGIKALNVHSQERRVQ